ncbi:DUF6756 family protein [Flavobacterium sp. IB48]|uniref:DUF6756 family protein n=1 Tax=Flavobacterium sp. IB48 TaxID=2779375 RepID=UPI0018E846E8|nr:DUF6756 family protein [Flavobacterium sp. IB48]MBJ2127143.1 hypothetical protein [Flavobacterium sp. IB48]
MRKERNLLRKNWSNLRAEIANIINKKEISKEDFRPLSTNENWEKIENNIINIFCNLSHSNKKPTWIWTDFKLDTFALSNLAQRPENYLDKLVDEEENVWYIVNETINESDKFWFYEGKIKTIQIIIGESWFSELYIVSKKYEWLITINHHDTLIATGKTMSDKLRGLEIIIKKNPN